jgi:hypothetical protein
VLPNVAKRPTAKFDNNAALSKYRLQFVSNIKQHIAAGPLSAVNQLFFVSALHRKNNSRPQNVATFRSRYSFNFNLLLVLHKQPHLELLVGEQWQTVE